MIQKEAAIVGDDLDISTASDASGLLPGHLGLRLDEIFLPLMAVHDTAERLDKIIPFGHVKSYDGMLHLRFWPDMIWLNGLPSNVSNHAVDISHGMAHFSLRGVEALHFIAHYTTANVFDAPISKAQAIRTMINHYPCVIWWENTRHVHLVTDRSLAQSFADHLRTLAVRHDPLDPSTLPRPIHPDAPDRRG
jgi:hypothetical protein